MEMKSPYKQQTAPLYCLPITQSKQRIENFYCNKLEDRIILRAVVAKSNKKIAIKLTHSFSEKLKSYQEN